MADDDLILGSEGCGPALFAVDIQKGERVLDLGCGNGKELLRAAQLAGSSGLAIGLDIDPQKIEAAKANAAQRDNTDIELYLGDATNLPFGDCSIDAVYSNCVLNLVDNKLRVFAEVKRVLKPSGRFVFADIVAIKRNVPKDALGKAACIIGCLNGALHVDEYIELLSSSGFNDVRSKLFAAIPYSLIARRAKAAASDTVLEKTDRWLLNDALASVVFYCSNSSIPKRVAL